MLLRDGLQLPLPKSISIWWNFGSLLGLSIVIQIASGIFLAIIYRGGEIGFDSLIHLIRDVPGGWMVRLIHCNGARIYFLLIYIHIGRALYYQRYATQPNSFIIGSAILILRIAVAFLGYVLPWGQISYWGATVITNLLRAVPIIGPRLVRWVWGGFAVSGYTLTRFYVLHFLGPFLIAGLSILHLYFLHFNGRTNPIGLITHYRKITFKPYFLYKDSITWIILVSIIFYTVIFIGYGLIDPENFIIANRISTPAHIQPEWYFLFAYAILRSIPRKVGGVIGLISAVAILFIKPLILNSKNFPLSTSLRNQILVFLFFLSFIILTYIGAIPVESPYIFLSQAFGVLYFIVFIFI